jgi:peptidoglycan/xylan/chitin deacetylase (PgdA/CDA1 family)
MNSIAVDHQTDSLACRFLLAEEGAFGAWLAADIRAARLSAAFRAYYRLRRLLPPPIRRFLQRRRRRQPSPRWCFPDAFMQALVEQLAARDGGVTAIDPWPGGARFAFVLTHDVETACGMRRIAAVAELEERLGFRSSWNIVPYKYAVDFALVGDLRARGFEIGVHGYNHDGRLFTSRAVFDRRVPGINAALESFGAAGFRAPMVHRNLHWLQALRIEYDASCFDADPYQAMPGGVGGLWPFIAGRFVELPYTLPQDHTLFIVLGQRDGRTWLDKLRYIARRRGMALALTHPDYLDTPPRLEAYRRLLEAAREQPGMWHALPREVAAWWRERDASSLHQDPGGRWRIAGPAANRARVATIRAVPSAARAPVAGATRTTELEWSHDSPAAAAAGEVKSQRTSAELAGATLAGRHPPCGPIE